MTHQVATCHKKQSFSGKPTLSRIALLVALQISASALPISITHAEEQADESITVYGQANEAYAAGKISKASSIGMLGDKDFLDTPFNAIGYTDKHIQDQHAQDISDVISASDPSVFTSGETGLNKESFKIRGFSSDIGDVMFNGLYGIAPYYRSSPEMYQRIDVLKGPASLLNGMPPNGSVGGSINLVTKRAQEAPITSFTGTYMSDSQFGGHIDIGRRFGENEQFGVRFNGVFRDGDASVDGQSRKAQLASLSLDWRNDIALIEADLYFSTERVDGANRGLSIASGVDVPSPPSSDTLLSPSWAYNDSEDKGMMIRAELDLSNSVTAYGAVGASRTDFDSNVPQRVKIIDDSGTLEVSLGSVKLESKRTSGEVGIRSSFDTGPIEHYLVLNSTYFREDKNDSPTGNNNPESWNPNIYNPVWGPEDSTYDNYYELPVDSTQISFGVADTLSLANGKYQLTLGLRHQSIDYESGVTWNGNAFPTTKLKESTYTPAIAALYKVSDSVSLYGNYTEGLTNGKTAGSGAANVGEAFEPQKTKQTEAGLKLDMNDFAHTFSLFEIKKPNGYQDPDTNIYSFGGEQRNRGIEWGFYGTVLEDYTLTGGIAYTDAEITKATDVTTEGKQATKLPDLQAKLALEWNLPVMRQLTLIGQANYMSEQYIDAQNTQSLSAQTIFDLGARYNSTIANQSVIWRLAVNNVTDEAYWTTTHYASLALGAPRTVMLSATADF
ncbi:TonB-dependent receptor [Vibrio splendidus]|uniref:TonB-dependent receptor n=1 Tax=Vibrio splendidus TaxID=29497 RepID=UPI000C823F3E|nr:TonB-dependent receptor [Vibrio splendidus]MBT9243533.1 TonB-dependent receptor [Vibrio splendidus]MCW4442714.1 TonB-dependent receptor [Vibrio splendidus]MDP2614760.1 TonB-dependent receptor [Vibrio splendidus]PMH71180.1 ferric anguibactin receptor [Vibrio splendidus]PMJ26780.1 ferric anguibactin receptor [Vibrio splendidus]